MIKLLFHHTNSGRFLLLAQENQKCNNIHILIIPRASLEHLQSISLEHLQSISLKHLSRASLQSISLEHLSRASLQSISLEHLSRASLQSISLEHLSRVSLYSISLEHLQSISLEHLSRASLQSISLEHLQKPERATHSTNKKQGMRTVMVIDETDSDGSASMESYKQKLEAGQCRQQMFSLEKELLPSFKGTGI